MAHGALDYLVGNRTVRCGWCESHSHSRLPSMQAVTDLKVVANYDPAGDQAEAIAGLFDGLDSGLAQQT